MVKTVELNENGGVTIATVVFGAVFQSDYQTNDVLFIISLNPIVWVQVFVCIVPLLC